MNRPPRSNARMMRRGIREASRSDAMQSSMRRAAHHCNSVGESRCESRIGFGDLAAYAAADQREYFGIGRSRVRHLVRALEFEAGLVADFLDAVLRMHA